MIIRQAEVADAAALEAVFLDTFESTWRPNLLSAAVDAYLTETRAADFIARRGLDFWLAERDGVVVGLIHWRENFINSLHVLGDHARTGVGTRLMALAEAEIAASGYDTVRLETDTFNRGSQAFYSARGYHELDRYPDHEWNSGLTTVLLSKPLA